MANYFFDSDVLIWCLRGQKESLSFFREALQEGIPACSSLTILEVELGMRKGEEVSTQYFLDGLHVFPVSKELARQAAHYIRFYKSKGRQIDLTDAVIASTCVEENFTLVTYNLKHYPMSELKIRTP